VVEATEERAATAAVSPDPVATSRFTPLLAALAILLFVVAPSQARAESRSLLLDAVISAVFVTGAWAVSGRRRVALVGGGLALVALAAQWAPWTTATDLPTFAAASAALLIAFVLAVLLRAVLASRLDAGERIRGAICVYLLLATLWALAFALLERAAPGSFDGLDPAAAASDRPSDFLYFSLVTLTTLGYGDVRPVGAAARSLATLEALTGQLYLAILIARLVALGIVDARQGRR